MKNYSSGLIFNLHDECQTLAFPFRKAGSTHRESRYPGVLVPTEYLSFKSMSHLSPGQTLLRSHHSIFNENIPLTSKTHTLQKALESYTDLLPPAHSAAGSSSKGTGAGSGAFLLQAYRHYSPGNTQLIHHEDTTIKQEQKYISVSITSFIGFIDLPVASVIGSSKQNTFSGWQKWF